jgi:hypothetical protein
LRKSISHLSICFLFIYERGMLIIQEREHPFLSFFFIVGTKIKAPQVPFDHFISRQFHQQILLRIFRWMVEQHSKSRMPASCKGPWVADNNSLSVSGLLAPKMA